MNELTNEQQMVAQLFSVLCAVVQSDRTPAVTVAATMQTLEKIFNDDNGPFMDNEDSRAMTQAMINTINGIVKNKVKAARAEEGDSILSNINWN